MKILVLGASGMLGFAVHRTLHDAGFNVLGALRGAESPDSNWCRNLRYIHKVDVQNMSGVVAATKKFRPAVIINAVGVTQRDNDESSQLRLFAINALFPRLLGSMAHSLGARFIHFSTDGVFSGDVGMYDECAEPTPTDLYGMSKLLGESLDHGCLVIRTSVIGRGLRRNNSLVDWFLAQRAPVRGFRRAMFSGLPANEIANVLAQKILPRPAPLNGLYHLSAARISKYDLLCLLQRTWSLKQIQLIADDSVVIDRSLDSRRLKKAIAYEVPSWNDLVGGMRAFYEQLDS